MKDFLKAIGWYEFTALTASEKAKAFAVFAFLLAMAYVYPAIIGA